MCELGPCTDDGAREGVIPVRSRTDRTGAEPWMRGFGEDLAAIHAAGFTQLAAAAAQELLGRLERRSRVVDLGCGDGTTARLLTEAGHEVLGIDASPALIALARERAPDATFRVGSFVDAELPERCDAILAIGEVLGYRFDARSDEQTLDRVLARAARALRPRGLMLFDLAGPKRVPSGGQRTWQEGDGWAVLVQATAAGGDLQRRVVTFRELGPAGYRRSEELHRLRLHAPAEVLARLRAAGFAARTLPRGYAGQPLPRGLTAYIGRKR
jgi:SAM-dependent methyltransferase